MTVITIEKISELENLLKDHFENHHRISYILSRYTLNADLQIKLFNIENSFAADFINFTPEFCNIIFNLEFYNSKSSNLIIDIVSRMINLQSLEAKEYLNNFFRIYPYSGNILKSWYSYKKLSELTDIKEILKSFLESKIHVNESFVAETDDFKKISINNKTFSQIKLLIVKKIIHEINNNDLLELAYLNFPQLIRTSFYGNINKKTKDMFSDANFKKEFLNKNFEYVKSKAILEILCNNYLSLEEFNEITANKEKESKKEKLWFKF